MILARNELQRLLNANGYSIAEINDIGTTEIGNHLIKCGEGELCEVLEVA